MISGFVCYCPDLRLYHYRLKNDEKKPPSDVADYKFSEEELLTVLEHLVSQSKEPEADAVALLSGFGRLYPHKIVECSSDESGAFTVKELREPEPEASLNGEPVGG